MTTGVGIRLPDMPSATGFTDSDFVFMTQNGATVKGTVAQLKTAVAVNATLETFVSGTNFTPGVTTSLTLANTYASPNNIGVFFDGAPQFDFTLSGTTLSFPNGGIPQGTQKIFVKGVVPRSIGAPSAGTVDDNTVKIGSALYRRINSFVDVTDPQWGGCDLAGVADCTTAVRAAIAYALAHGISGVYFPAGTYRFFAASPSLDRKRSIFDVYQLTL
ncbi:hypothetical protein SAMN05446927_5402 [Caballeronia arationis]|uniref:Pectate lyase superfamily protein n=2 Tax=Caballeronia arationis TaxID=1777142 RepID=A0A7Z7N4L2_9BURK|nr:hypothetical protein SAMN05446927_5402 [Caballeronia arationis]